MAPCAKLNSPEAEYDSTSPVASRAYSAPDTSPLSTNPSRSDIPTPSLYCYLKGMGG